MNEKFWKITHPKSDAERARDAEAASAEKEKRERAAPPPADIPPPPANTASVTSVAGAGTGTSAGTGTGSSPNKYGLGVSCHHHRGRGLVLLLARRRMKLVRALADVERLGARRASGAIRATLALPRAVTACFPPTHHEPFLEICPHLKYVLRCPADKTPKFSVAAVERGDVPLTRFGGGRRGRRGVGAHVGSGGT